MIWGFVLIVVLVMGAIYYWSREDRRYLDKQVREVISERVREDIKKDHDEFTRRQLKFGKAMEDAKTRTP